MFERSGSRIVATYGFMERPGLRLAPPIAESFDSERRSCLPGGHDSEQPFEELVGRTDGLQPWRRVFHVVGGSCVAWTVYTLSPLSAATRWLFGVLFVVSFVADLLRVRSETLNRFFFRRFSALASPREAEGMTGFPSFVLGVFVVLWLPGGALAVPSILVLSFSDPAASTVGRLWGKHPLGTGTLEGTSAFFVTAVVVLVPFAGVWSAVLVAALAAGSEVLPSGLDDNLVVPVATAAGLWALSGVA